MSPNLETRKALALAANDNGDAELTIEQMKFDLVDQGLGDLIAELVRDHPDMSEAEAITRLHDFY